MLNKEQDENHHIFSVIIVCHCVCVCVCVRERERGVHTYAYLKDYFGDYRVFPPKFYTYSIQLCVLVTKSCPTLSNLVDLSLPGSSVHGILQARMLHCHSPFQQYTVKSLTII